MHDLLVGKVAVCEDDQIHLEALNERGQFVLGKNRNVGMVERTG